MLSLSVPFFSPHISSCNWKLSSLGNYQFNASFWWCPNVGLSINKTVFPTTCDSVMMSSWFRILVRKKQTPGFVLFLSSHFQIPNKMELDQKFWNPHSLHWATTHRGWRKAAQPNNKPGLSSLTWVIWYRDAACSNRRLITNYFFLVKRPRKTNQHKKHIGT